MGGRGAHLWALVFRCPHPGPAVPTEKTAVSLALPHELLFSCCFPDFPFVTASSIFARMCYLPSWTACVLSAHSSRDPGQTRRPLHLTISCHAAQWTPTAACL